MGVSWLKACLLLVLHLHLYAKGRMRSVILHTCAGGVDITLLQEAVHLIGGRLETEASGNVTLETVGAIAQSGCDFISCGALTHSVKALDISFNISVQPR